jgi:hypothetical protein
MLSRARQCVTAIEVFRGALEGDYSTAADGAQAAVLAALARKGAVPDAAGIV